METNSRTDRHEHDLCCPASLPSSPSPPLRGEEPGRGGGNQTCARTSRCKAPPKLHVFVVSTAASACARVTPGCSCREPGNPCEQARHKHAGASVLCRSGEPGRSRGCSAGLPRILRPCPSAGRLGGSARSQRSPPLCPARAPPRSLPPHPADLRGSPTGWRSPSPRPVRPGLAPCRTPAPLCLR